MTNYIGIIEVFSWLYIGDLLFRSSQGSGYRPHPKFGGLHEEKSQNGLSSCGELT